MVGKTHSDEMAYSLNGENVDYGTPINPKAPDRIPGGSSSGSAVAVARELVDFALGTDCGGSVRLPASYCGIFGIETIGWFARNAVLMRRIGEVLLPPASTFVPTRLLIATDSLADSGPAITEALAPGVASVGHAFASIVEQRVYARVPSEWVDIFRLLQGAEIAQ